MQRTFSVIGALVLAAWTAGGALAWWQAQGHWTLVVQEGEPGPSVEDERLALLDEQVQSLSGDLRALSGILEQNLGVLDERAAERDGEQRAALERELGTLRADLARVGSSASELDRSLDRRLAALRAGWRADLDAALAERPAPELASEPLVALEPPPDAPPPEPEAAEPEPTAEPAPPVPARRASFLAFELPSDDFRFDERRSWTVIPALSRVGFDGESTLHDFTGTTSEVRGRIAADLAHPDASPDCEVRVVRRRGWPRDGQRGP
jgi:hypothetical protein